VSVADGPFSGAIRSSATRATRGPRHSCARGPRRSRRSRPGRQHLAWTGSGALAQGRDRTEGCEKDSAALPSTIATTRIADAVALPQEQQPPVYLDVYFEHGSICAASGTTALAALAPRVAILFYRRRQ
jgi:hypothetical protein